MLFLILNASKFDLRHLNLNVLKDYLMSLNKTKISKNVLQDFIKYTLSKISKECLNQLFPMNQAQRDEFLAQAQYNNCPNFLKAQCKNLTHPLETKIENISLTEDHEWIYKDHSVQAKNDKLLNIPTENQVCEINSATFSNKDINQFLYSEKCYSCQIAESNINCKFKTNNKINLLETLKQLFVAIDKLQTKNLGSLPHKVVDFNKFFSHLCFTPANLTRLLKELAKVF